MLSLANGSGKPTLSKLALSRTCLQNRTFELGVSLLLLASFPVFSAACGSSANADLGAGAAAAGSGDAGADSGGNDSQTIALAFVPSTTTPLTLEPKASHQLTVQTTPPGLFRIRFALLGDNGAADAVLDADEVDTDAEGVAHVTLIAPSRPARFDVRASSTSPAQAVRQTVIVSATDVTTLRVRPSYSGRRQITEWTATASAQPGVSCNDLAGNPPPDGEHSNTAPLGTSLEIADVPVGVDLAVTVRAGHYIGGCVNVPALSEGDGNQVLVFASDRPLNLDGTFLSLSLGATEPHPAFDKLLQGSASLAENALLGSAKNDITALLDEMREVAPAAGREAFSIARTQNGWDSALESAFGKSSARRMRDPAQRWLTAGLLALDAPNALVGYLSPKGNAASFTLSTVGTATPSSAGFPGFFEATWSGDSNDTLLFGMDLNWEPSRLVTTLAVAPALSEFPQATSIENALSLSVGCAQVGQVLLASGVSPGNIAFASCDESCTVSLCSNAVAAAWGKAQLSSGAEVATLSITASGTARVGDEAQATQLDGTWLGELRTGADTAQVSGALSATSGAP